MKRRQIGPFIAEIHEDTRKVVFTVKRGAQPLLPAGLAKVAKYARESVRRLEAEGYAIDDQVMREFF